MPTLIVRTTATAMMEEKGCRQSLWFGDACAFPVFREVGKSCDGIQINRPGAANSWHHSCFVFLLLNNKRNGTEQ
jgi:hypothetical protein